MIDSVLHLATKLENIPTFQMIDHAKILVSYLNNFHVNVRGDLNGLVLIAD